MIELNGNEKVVLLNLLKAHHIGCSWHSAIFGTSITTEAGARFLLGRLVEWGFTSGGPSRFFITEEGAGEAFKIEMPQQAPAMF